MRARQGAWIVIAGFVGWASGPTALGAEVDPAAERGRVALTSRGYLPPAWGEDAYKNAGRLWESKAPDPEADPQGYAAAFNRRYGLHPAPYPNEGLPMGLRRARDEDGSRSGLQIDCMVCHGGSIGGTSYVGLGNTQLDLNAFLSELILADGKVSPPPLFTLNTARGTVNAGQISIVLLSLRNPDLSRRLFPLRFGASLPELDVPAWWTLGKKLTMYQDGRTDARSSRSLMQFFLGDYSLQQFQDLEPTFRDIHAYLRSIPPPRYPFAIDRARADRGRTIFTRTCTKCHGSYGPDGSYPNRIVELDVIGTDPARARGISPRFVAHYNATWFAEEYPVDEEMTGYQAPPLDGVWATAPYLHNGSVPTVYNLLKSSTRPARFRRPPSTDFEHYDTAHVGWKFQVVAEPTDSKPPVHEARFIYDTSRWGLGNGGHTFGDPLSEAERMDVIEYLKTL